MEPRDHLGSTLCPLDLVTLPGKVNFQLCKISLAIAGAIASIDTVINEMIMVISTMGVKLY